MANVKEERSDHSFFKRIEYYVETMVAVEAGVFVASAFVLSFVYVSFLKRMVDNSSKMSREKEESQRLREDYRH